MMFVNRDEAGILLARKLKEYSGRKNVVLMSVPRGGIQIGYRVAKELSLPLEVIISKKIPHPDNSEVAIGAVTRRANYIDAKSVEVYGIPEEYIEENKKFLKIVAERRHSTYHEGIQEIKIAGKIAILVDDGIATGHTIRAALKEIKKDKPKKIILAVPVINPTLVKPMKAMADEIIYIYSPENFRAVGQFYSDFGQIGDRRALELFQELRSGR